MAVGNWPKCRSEDHSYSSPPYGYFAQSFQPIAPATKWLGNYRMLWPADLAFVEDAKSAGLNVAATPPVVWNASGPDPNNKIDDQVANSITLVNSGRADAVVGTEVTANVGGHDPNTWADDTTTYIAKIKNDTGGKVPVGTNYPMAVFVADPTEIAAIQRSNRRATCCRSPCTLPTTPPASPLAKTPTR